MSTKEFFFYLITIRQLTLKDLIQRILFYNYLLLIFCGFQLTTFLFYNLDDFDLSFLFYHLDNFDLFMNEECEKMSMEIFLANINLQNVLGNPKKQSLSLPLYKFNSLVQLNQNKSFYIIKLLIAVICYACSNIQLMLIILLNIYLWWIKIKNESRGYLRHVSRIACSLVMFQ